MILIYPQILKHCWKKIFIIIIIIITIVEIGFNSLFLLPTFTLYIPICMEYVN